MKRKKYHVPVVQVVSLLSFSVFTLLGVFVGLPPDVVLVRVCIGTALVAMVTSGGVRLLKSIAAWPRQSGNRQSGN